MTDPTNQTSASKIPSHIAYFVHETKAGKSFWTPIGRAWAHADGNGFNLQIDVAPLNGRITLRIATERKE